MERTGPEMVWGPPQTAVTSSKTLSRRAARSLVSTLIMTSGTMRTRIKNPRASKRTETANRAIQHLLETGIP